MGLSPQRRAVATKDPQSKTEPTARVLVDLRRPAQSPAATPSAYAGSPDGLCALHLSIDESF